MSTLCKLSGGFVQEIRHASLCTSIYSLGDGFLPKYNYIIQDNHTLVQYLPTHCNGPSVHKMRRLSICRTGGLNNISSILNTI